MKNLMVLLVLLAGMWQGAAAGELTLGWNKHLDSAWVTDIEFMPDHKNFILMTWYDFQIRTVETGDIVSQFPLNLSKFYSKGSSNGDIEFTPDSTKILLAYTNKLELRNISDMSLIKSYEFKLNPNDSVPVLIRKILIDPKKPLAYLLWGKEGAPFGVQPWVDSSNIIVFNYETMQPVSDFGLTDKLKFILYADISKDGKYLTAINDGSTQIMVWSLDSMKMIRNFQLSSTQTGAFGLPTCVKFSELNSEQIYFSGTFPEFKDDTRRNGLFIYSLSENNIIDSTFGVGISSIPQGDEGYFTFFDNARKIIINSSGINLFLLNDSNKNIENNYINYSNTFAFGTKAINKNNTFIGIARQYFAMFKYDSLNSVANLSGTNETVYPNPTSSLLNINFDCNSSFFSYQIFDVNKKLLFETSLNSLANLSIDFSPYSTGIYFLILTCGNNSKTYKVIKEK